MLLLQPTDQTAFLWKSPQQSSLSVVPQISVTFTVCDTCHCVSAESALTCRGILGTPKKPQQTVLAALCLLLWSPFDAVEEDPLYVTNPSG